VFCPARANSKEHAIPEWISKRRGVRDFLPADSAFVVGAMEPRTQPISFASYRARVLCTDCNTHFKHLEDAVIPLLVPMARGISLSLDVTSRSRLALWAHKTAIALLAATPELRDAVPNEHRRAVRDNDHAHPDVWVGFFSWRGGPVLGTAQGSITNPKTRRRACDSYLAFLTFAQVGFAVVGLSDPSELNQVVGGQIPRALQFWPPTPGLDFWPPPALDNSVLPALLNFVPLRPA
jgi:hypothetical protein